jgi:hypothetical protein
VRKRAIAQTLTRMRFGTVVSGMRRDGRESM